MIWSDLGVHKIVINYFNFSTAWKLQAMWAQLKITILSRLSIFQSEKHLYSKRAPLIIPISHPSQPSLPFLPSAKQNRKCNELSKNCSTVPEKKC